VIGTFILAAFGLAPLVLVVGLGLWAWWLARRTSAPRWARRVAFVFVWLAGTVIVWGLAGAILAVQGFESESPQERQRALSHGVAAMFYRDVQGLLVAMVGGVWLGFSTWRWRRRAE